MAFPPRFCLRGPDRWNISMPHPTSWTLPIRQRSLIGILTWREIASRYRGALLGVSWAIVTPLLMLAVFTLVFGVVLQSRWPQAEDQGMGMFALQLLAGLLLHGILAESFGRAPALVVQQTNYVTKVVFPLEALAWVAALSAAFHGVLGLALLWLINGVWGTGFSLTQLALPLVVAPYLVLLVGLTLLFAALGVYLRDLQQVVGSLVMVCMFLGPVLFPRSNMPHGLRDWLLLNPLTVPVEQFRQVMFHETWPDWTPLAGYTLAALLVYAVGAAVFGLLKRGFADVL